jgi:RHS repeat-associated protein
VAVDACSYDPFGNLVSEKTPGFHNPLMYMGREYDRTTGLYYVRNRWYDPAVGRFISEDPIGLSGGINVYAYALNSPTNLRDPMGLSPERQCDGSVVFMPVITEDGEHRTLRVCIAADGSWTVLNAYQLPGVAGGGAPHPYSGNWTPNPLSPRGPGSNPEALGGRAIPGSAGGGGPSNPPIQASTRPSVER